MSDDPFYRPPESELKQAVTVPAGFGVGKMTPARLHGAYQAAIVFLVLSAVEIWWSFQGNADQPRGLLTPGAVLNLFNTALWVYLIYLFGLAINVRLQFHKINYFIIADILISLCLCAFNLTAHADFQQIGWAELGYLGLVSVYGLVYIGLGWQLLQIEQYYPYIKFIAKTALVTGICMASIVLLLVALIPSYMMTFAIIVLFKRMRDEAAEVNRLRASSAD